MSTRTETFRFMTTRPSQDRVAARVARFAEQTNTEVVEVGPVTVARTRGRTVAFDVTAKFRTEQEVA